MSFCPIEDNGGFVTLTGILTQALLDKKKVDGPPRIVLSIAPRSVPPHMSYSGGILHIDDTQSNTCTYNGITYDLIDIQMTAPVHAKGTSFHLPGQEATSAQYELILYFASRQAASATSRDGILMCFPLYSGTPSKNSDYIRQLRSSHMDPKDVKTIESLFTDCTESLAYSTCFETKRDEGVVKRSLYVLVFPRGIQMDNLATGSTFGAPQLPPAIRQTDPTLQSYTLNNGNKTMNTTTWSSMGEIATMALEVTSEAFHGRFEYFTKAPTNSNESRTSAISTSKYKCVPFNQLSSIGEFSNSHIEPGKEPTLQNILAEQYVVAQQQAKGDKVTEGLSTSTIETIVAVLVLVVVTFLVVIAVSMYYAKPSTALSTATTATSATTATASS